MAVVLGLAPGIFYSSFAEATSGFARFESSGFLRKASDRADSNTTVALGPRIQDEGKIFRGNLEVQGIAFLSDRQSFTLESTNAFIATSSRLSPFHQISVGRRLYDWSAMDDEWKMGIWSPRFNWEPIRPEQIGLTGAFYTYQSKKWRILGFASPISIPERGFPVRQEEGRLTSAGPFYVAPPDRVVLQGREVPVRYDINYPSTDQLIMNPSVAMQVRYGEEMGVWAQGSYGIKPIHQVDLAVSPKYFLQEDQVRVSVNPRILTHQLLTAEGGYRDRRFSIWASGSVERPFGEATPEDWITQPVGSTVILSAGIRGRMTDTIQLSFSGISIDETTPEKRANDIQIDLASRFMFRRALKMRGEWDAGRKVSYGAGWVMDVADRSSLVSMDLNFYPGFRDPGAKGGAWLLNVGGDLFFSNTSQGFLGQFLGNDRVRGGVAYAF
jgi:hypothetical protein